MQLHNIYYYRNVCSLMPTVLQKYSMRFYADKSSYVVYICACCVLYVHLLSMYYDIQEKVSLNHKIIFCSQYTSRKTAILSNMTVINFMSSEQLLHCFISIPQPLIQPPPPIRTQPILYHDILAHSWRNSHPNISLQLTSFCERVCFIFFISVSSCVRLVLLVNI